MSRDNKFVDSLQTEFKRLSQRVTRIETWEPNQVVYSTSNVTNPPTATELIAAFGSASSFKAAKKMGILDNNGAGTNVYLVFSNGTSYYYLLFTLAV